MLMFTIALDLKTENFNRILKNPLPVSTALIAQFLLLPVGTFIATLFLDLPANIEAGMLLVASCPCGGISNFVTHHSGGNTALAVSISAVANVLALILTPLNFTWMVSNNPNTANWLRDIQVDPSQIWINLLIVLAIPLTAGMLTRFWMPGVSKRIRQPLGRFSMIVLILFIVAALYKDRHLLVGVSGLLIIVVLHNASGLLIGYLTGVVARLPVADIKALVFETGMQNAALAVAIIGSQFNADAGMLVIAGLWAIWHNSSGLVVAQMLRVHAKKNLPVRL
jgi:BASS family bile acid:Na+ symporter